MVPINDSLSELSELSKRLNTETDAFNEVIAGVEAQLAEMQIGVSVWNPTLLDEVIESAWTTDDTGITNGYVIGYAKLADGWRIASKQVQVVSRFDGDDPDNPFVDTTDSGGAYPLLDAPRHIRVEAAGQLENLIHLLKRRVETFLQDIEKSKKLLEEK